MSVHRSEFIHQRNDTIKNEKVLLLYLLVVAFAIVIERVKSGGVKTIARQQDNGAVRSVKLLFHKLFLNLSLQELSAMFADVIRKGNEKLS